MNSVLIICISAKFTFFFISFSYSFQLLEFNNDKNNRFGFPQTDLVLINKLFFPTSQDHSQSRSCHCDPSSLKIIQCTLKSDSNKQYAKNKIEISFFLFSYTLSSIPLQRNNNAKGICSFFSCYKKNFGIIILGILNFTILHEQLAHLAVKLFQYIVEIMFLLKSGKRGTFQLICIIYYLKNYNGLSFKIFINIT